MGEGEDDGSPRQSAKSPREVARLPGAQPENGQKRPVRRQEEEDGQFCRSSSDGTNPGKLFYIQAKERSSRRNSRGRSWARPTFTVPGLRNVPQRKRGPPRCREKLASFGHHGGDSDLHSLSFLPGKHRPFPLLCWRLKNAKVGIGPKCLISNDVFRKWSSGQITPRSAQIDEGTKIPWWGRTQCGESRWRNTRLAIWAQ